MSEFWIVRLDTNEIYWDFGHYATLGAAETAMDEAIIERRKIYSKEMDDSFGFYFRIVHMVLEGVKFEEVDYLEPKGFGLLPTVDDKQAGIFIGHPGGGGTYITKKDGKTHLTYAQGGGAKDDRR